MNDPWRPANGDSTARPVGLLIAGHSGRIGTELCRQLSSLQETAQTPRADLRIAGLINSRETRWPDRDKPGVTTFPRHPGDWPHILRRFLSRDVGTRMFVDCTAGRAFACHYAALLQHRIGIVTPNKLANSGALVDYLALRQVVDRHATPYQYETTVGAALPVLGALADIRTRGDRVTRIEALVSGSLSFIFGRLNQGMTFSTAVRDARAHGFTEPHPASDLQGTDSGRKLLIMLREAEYHWELDRITVDSLVPAASAAEPDPDRFVAGLAAVDAEWTAKITAARRRNLRLVYLARFDRRGARAGITHVSNQDPFALLAPGENLIRIWTEQYQPIPLSISGPGAGPVLTAAGILTDILKGAQFMLRNAGPDANPA